MSEKWIHLLSEIKRRISITLISQLFTLDWGNFRQKRGNFGQLKTLTKVRNLIFFLQILMNFANQNVLYYILIKKSNKTFPFSYWKGGQSLPRLFKVTPNDGIIVYNNLYYFSLPLGLLKV